MEWASVSWMFFGELVDTDIGDPPPALATTPVLEAVTLGSKSAGLCEPLSGPILDELFDFSWHLFDPAEPSFDVNVPAAWEVCGGSAETVVAVLDDGVQPDHPDLPNQVPGVDVTNDCPSPPCPGGEPRAPCDRHGTAVAGVIASAANSIGTRGVAPRVSIMSIRTGKYTLNSSPDTNCIGAGRQETLAKGIVHAINSGVDVINISWNYGVSVVTPELSLAAAKADQSGIMLFNSAGNRSLPRVEIPGTLGTVNSISAFDRAGNIASFSNSGLGIAFSAPGTNILTTDRLGMDGFGPQDTRSVNGTSYAAPLLAGQVGLIYSCRPDFSSGDIEFLLRKTAIDMGEPGWDPLFGWGRPNVEGSVLTSISLISGDDFETGDLSRWDVVTTEGSLLQTTF